MKNFLKKIIKPLKHHALAAALCAVFSAALLGGVTVLASSIPTVTFTNTPNNSPDLYVTKTTQDKDGYLVDTDEEFTFYLKLDGELANKVTYRVYNSSGEEVYLYADGESTEVKSNKLTFQTTKYGEFTLKSGQTARFEWLGTGVSYEVTEEAADGWTQIVPTNGSSALGTITTNGSTAKFINIQDSPVDLSRIYVYKTVSFPDGYTSPETPDFTFKITISNAAYDYETYNIINVKTGLSEGTGTTDADGQFTLKGGQVAIFSVEEDVDYRVEELETAGWRITTDSSFEGSTGKGKTTVLTFNNATASFAVSKTTQADADGNELDADLEYTFQLVKEDKSIWDGATYYLYNTDGTPVYDQGGEITTGVTDANGQFTLKANQTAIFYGIESGTIYSVYEIKSTGYSQVTPQESTGYSNKVVSDSVEVLPFVNEPSNENALSVTKVIESADGHVPSVADEFTFYLYSSDDGTTFDPVVGAVYSITVGTDTYTYATGDDGSFTLCGNQTALFETLTDGIYKVVEGDTTVEYILSKVEHTDKDGTVQYDSTDPTIGTDAQLELAQVGTLSSDGLNYTFTNSYTSYGVDLYLVKKNSNDETLAGAQFMLYYDADMTAPYSADPYETGTDGLISIMNIPVGTYYLKEIQAPSGYGLLAEPICISITRTVSGFTILVDGEEYTDATATKLAGELNITGEAGHESIYLAIYNSRFFGIPSSGGTTTYVTLIAGIGCMLIAAAVVFRRKKKA